MELYAAVRRSVYVEGLSERAAARRFGLARETVRKMLRYRRPPGYRRAQPVRRPKLDAFTGVIDQILREDQSCRGAAAVGEGDPHARLHTRQRQDGEAACYRTWRGAWTPPTRVRPRACGTGSTSR